MSSGLWVPGAAGPQDALIDRINGQVAALLLEAGQAFVEIELADGARYTVESISAEPGFGFVTLRPHPGDDVPAQVIVPVGSIKRIELSAAADERGQLGFSP